jgi:hypothetical protein
MKQIGFLALTILLSVTQIQAQSNKTKVDPAKAKVDTNSNKVEMAFENTVDGITAHDYGSIVYGANGKFDFNFTNNGTKPIIISDVKSSCGCTVPTWTKEPVEPGKQGTVSVIYNTTLAGVFNKTVVVYSNASNSPVRLEIRGKINAQPSDLQPKTINEKPKDYNMVEETGGKGQVIKVDSATAAKAAVMNGAQNAAQQESFKKLMEQKPSDSKSGKPKVVTSESLNQQTTPPPAAATAVPVAKPAATETKKKKK